MSAKLLSVFPFGELIVSAVNGLKVSFLKEAKNSFKHLPVSRRETKRDFFAAQQFGHDYRHSASIINLVDKTALFELSHDAIIDNVLDPQ